MSEHEASAAAPDAIADPFGALNRLPFLEILSARI